MKEKVMKDKMFTLYSVVLGLLLIAWGPTESLAEAAGGKPNVVLILADDMGWSDLGSYGGEIETPTLDRLAAEGIRFTQFYNGSKCQETRASLLSGQYWQDSGGRAFRSGVTMGHAMRQAGYATFAVGKWHLASNPVDRGFDRYFGHLGGGTDFFKGHSSFRLDSQPFDVSTIEDFYATDAKADFAIRFIDELRNEDRDKPFFLYLAFTAPHSPIQARPEDIERYRGRYRIGWDEIRRQRYERMVELGVFDDQWPLSPRPGTIPAWDELSEIEQDFEDMRMATYAAMVDRMDQAIGRVLARIAELEEDGDTLVMFLSDNGASPFDRHRRGTFYQEGERLPDADAGWQYGLGWANVSNTPFQHYKRNMFLGGQLTPLIAHWPAGMGAAGEIIDEPAHIIDLMPTFVDIAGSRWPTEFGGEEVKPLPGKSFRPLLKGGRFEREKPLFFHLYDHRAVIDGDWKLVSDWGRPWALFNLAEDRTELNNLAEEEPRQFLRLKNLWHVWWSQRDPEFTLFRTTDTTRWIEPVYRHLDDDTEDTQGLIR
jgi:arylsulfatase A-like enzyme